MILFFFRDILRDKLNSDSGKELAEIMNAGHLISDELAHAMILENIASPEMKRQFNGALLDGYPRTINQANLLDIALKALQPEPNFKAIDIKLETSVAIAKLLNRKQCATCGESFNTAHIVTGTYDMPAILPDPLTCQMKEKCTPGVWTTRADDTEETISVRLRQHELNIKPILDYYKKTGELRTFNVFKGVKDVDALIELIKETP